MTSTFQDLSLDSKICEALELCGYVKPTPVQAKSIPEILAGRDVIVSAQTGSGKTAAFVLPSLERLANSTPQKNPRILILTPTRELSNQIMQGLDKYGKAIRFFRVNLVGGMPYDRQLKHLKKGVDVVVATPGRLMDHMSSGRVDLSELEVLVLDEADRMLDMGFIHDIKEIAKKTPASRQTLLFSATFDKQIAHIAKQLLKDPVRIDFAHEALSPKSIKQEVYLTDTPQHKTQLLEHLLENAKIFKAIIFTATKRGADKLAEALRADGISAAPLHGDLKQNARNRTIEQMRKGNIQYLIATDVAARGIDISDITHVINYDLPKFAEDYVHRIGRTGRAGKSGVAISLALPSDQQHLKKIEAYIEQKIERLTIPGLEPKKGSAYEDRSFGKKSKDRSHHAKKPFSSKKSSERFSKDREEGSGGYRGKKKFSGKPNRYSEQREDSGRQEKKSFNHEAGGYRGKKKFGGKPSENRDQRSEGGYRGKKFSSSRGKSRRP